MSADVDFKACRHMTLKTLRLQYVQKRPSIKVLIARIYDKNVRHEQRARTSQICGKSGYIEMKDGTLPCEHF